MEARPTYSIHFAADPPTLDDRFDSAAWKVAKPIAVAQFRPESSPHRPDTAARMMYSTTGLHGIFQVHDQYVRATHLGYQSDVWKDSCVEFFVQAKADMGYFNFEMNCGGSLLCSHVIDPARKADGGLTKAVKVPEQIGSAVRVRSTLPQKVDPEIAEAICWEVSFHIPFALFEAILGPLGSIKGQQWRCNFYKCAEEVSHPHWAAWSPVDALNFHLPHCFGFLVFG